MKLLVVKLSSLGDVVHTFAFVNHLKKERPDISVDWVVNDMYAGLVKCNSGVGRVWHFKRGTWGKQWNSPSTFSEITSLLSWIRKEKYDVCLDMQGLLRSGLLTFFSGAGKKAGFANAREGSKYLYDTRIDAGEKPHAADILLRSLEIFNVTPPEKPDFRFTIPEKAESSVKKLMAELGISGPYMVFHTGARWDTKMWSVSHWSVLAKAVANKSKMPLVFTGSAADAAVINAIIAGQGRMFNLAGGLGLVESAALLKNCALMVTVDSGPMHIAAAFDRPIVAIFGPTSPAKTGPVTQGPADIIQQGHIGCVPCFDRKCKRNYECMEKISPDMVEFRVMRILSHLGL